MSDKLDKLPYRLQFDFNTKRKFKTELVLIDYL